MQKYAFVNANPKGKHLENSAIKIVARYKIRYTLSHGAA